MSMRVAIAGGGGFGYILAREIAQTATNAVLVLSTRHRPEYDELGIQVAIVDYSNIEELRYTLRGVDLLISTIRDPDVQLSLIDAARNARVGTFVPAEFEGAVAERPPPYPDLASDQQSEIIRQHLSATNGSMRHTVFSCGVFYQRFLPGGLGTMDIGRSMTAHSAGAYLLNIETASAEVTNYTPQGTPVVVSMTSVHDVAKYIAAAVELGPEHWPTELRLRGDRLTVDEIVSACSTARGIPFTVNTYDYSSLPTHLDYAWTSQNLPRYRYFQQLRATADGRYDFEHPNLNELIDQTDGVEVRPQRFREWLWQMCGHAPLRLPPPPVVPTMAMP